jgi:hypothetical protein
VGLGAARSSGSSLCRRESADGALDAGSDRAALAQGGILLAGVVADLQFLRGKPTVRLPPLEVVYAALARQGWHWLLVTWATISEVPSARVGQPWLAWPWSR